MQRMRGIHIKLMFGGTETERERSELTKLVRKRKGSCTSAGVFLALCQGVADIHKAIVKHEGRKNKSMGGGGILICAMNLWHAQGLSAKAKNCWTKSGSR